MNDFYYKSAHVNVRGALNSDIRYLKNRLRESDIKEIWASHHLTPEEALVKSIKETIFSFTACYHNEPVAVFGINGDLHLSNRGVIWLLASKEIKEISMIFLLNSRKYIEKFLEIYPYLYNFVDARNKESISWLKFCGAEISDPAPYGVEKLPFHYFFLRGERKCAFQ